MGTSSYNHLKVTSLFALHTTCHQWSDTKYSLVLFISYCTFMFQSFSSIYMCHMHSRVAYCGSSSRMFLVLVFFYNINVLIFAVLVLSQLSFAQTVWSWNEQKQVYILFCSRTYCNNLMVRKFFIEKKKIDFWFEAKLFRKCMEYMQKIWTIAPENLRFS